MPPAISRVFFITSDDVVENLRVERVDNKKGKSSGSRGTGGGGGCNLPPSKIEVKLFPLNRFSTLTYLINAQDGINEQEGNFLKIINQAGWNNRAGRANFEAIINEQGGKD